MKETKKIERKNGVTHVTIVQDFRPQIGDKVKFLIVEKGVMRMVEGRIFNINRETEQVSISYKDNTYIRTFEQFEQIN